MDDHRTAEDTATDEAPHARKKEGQARGYGGWDLVRTPKKTKDPYTS